MADADEDVIHLDPADGEGDDDTPDFRSFAALLRSKSITLPKRGEKDFEHHGTNEQADILAASRQEMHSALSYVRVHRPDRHIGAVYEPETGLTRVDHPKTKLFMSIGKTDSKGVTRLLPEEALYLLERGDLDVRREIPSDGLKKESTQSDTCQLQGSNIDDGTDETVGESSQTVTVMSFSLQTAYAVYIGEDDKSVSLERYNVYSNLKRAGFSVLRGPAWFRKDHDKDLIPKREPPTNVSTNVWSWLYELVHQENSIPQYGPLLGAGPYRSYPSIYRQIALIPRHNPTLPTLRERRSEGDDLEDISLRVSFYVYKPRDGFRKSDPGPPDFRIAVLDARDAAVPSIEQLDGLLCSTPFDPPNPATEADNAGKMYARLKKGYRNVILAVVDRGLISYLRIADPGFGNEKLYDGAGRNKFGNKGGGRGRGHPRGRGRGGGGRGRGAAT